MADAADAAPTLGQLVDLAAQLQLDRDRPDAELRRRDREIGRETTGGRRARVLAWLDRIGQIAELPGAKAVASRRLVATGLVVIGLVLGFAAARLVYFYDGARPVNIIEVLVFFVAVQLALLCVTAIAMLPTGLRRRLPGLSELQDALGVLSPGRWQSGLARILPQAQREALALVLGRGRSHQKLFGNVQKWTVLLGSQSFGVAFHIGALAGCLYLVSFTDLAFGWSTTLEVEPSELQWITEQLSAPWVAFAPEARPSISLIDATRYFRLGRGSLPGSGDMDAIDPAALGGWWPFCAACMVLYGLLPRLLLWLIARRCVASEVAKAFDRLPGLEDLYDRLEQPLVLTAALDVEAPGPERAVAVNSRPAPDLTQRRCAVVNWSDVEMDDGALAALIEQLLHAGTIGVGHAGGSRSLRQDRETIRASADAEAVAIAVRAWEPPVLEFIDFAIELRSALATDVPIVVVPIALGPACDPVEPSDTDVAQWQRRVESTGDPWFSVRAFGGWK